jgi:basic membrane protein A
MRLRRIIVAGLVSTVLLSLMTMLPLAQATAPLHVGVAYDTGGPGDHSFDDAVVRGLAIAQKRFPIQVSATVTVGSDADRELRLRWSQRIAIRSLR